MNEWDNRQRPANPRRRRKTKLQLFKETYLPVIIMGAALLLILVFIVGACSRSAEEDRRAEQEQKAAAQQKAEEEQRLQDEADRLTREAALAAAGYDYETAVDILEQFSGNWNDYPQVREDRLNYLQAKDTLVAWDDPSKILNLSVQMLIADSNRAYNDAKYANAFNRNFLTVEEFSRILDQLYENGYVLVNLKDIYTTKKAIDGSDILIPNTVYLPQGKTPFVLTQTNVNYHTYLTDGDGDLLPDGKGRGFASKLIFDSNGELINEYVDAQGNVHTGTYDMIPMLNSFIKAHPDFSYRGAKAVIALTGYDGLFGYRTNPKSEREFGTAVYEQQIEGAKAVADKLIADGYELACYTHENTAYGRLDAKKIQAEMDAWNAEVVPILPQITIFAFAQNSDIGTENTHYNDQRFNILSDSGFRIFLGFSTSGSAWSVMTDNYVRQGRILLCPNTIAYHSSWFTGMLDTSQILDPNRGQIPA